MTMESQHAAVQRPVPVLQIVGYKNSGKTTLACRLIHALSAQGLRVGSAKHDAHQFQLDDPGTDSSRHLLHGAVETVLTRRRRPGSCADLRLHCGKSPSRCAAE